MKLSNLYCHFNYIYNKLEHIVQNCRLQLFYVHNLKHKNIQNVYSKHIASIFYERIWCVFASIRIAGIDKVYCSKYMAYIRLSSSRQMYLLLESLIFYLQI